MAASCMQLNPNCCNNTANTVQATPRILPRTVQILTTCKIKLKIASQWRYCKVQSKPADTAWFPEWQITSISCRRRNNITVATAKTVAFDKVTVGNVVVDKTTSKITGLTAGTDDLDAVNVSQLKAVQAAATATDNFAVKYDQNTDGSVNKDSVTLTGTTASNERCEYR